MAEDPSLRTDPSPSGHAKPHTRRHFNDRDKLRIPKAAERASRPGELGLLLRREGIYSSHMACWRRWRRRTRPKHEQSRNPPTDSQQRREMARLAPSAARRRRRPPGVMAWRVAP